MCKKALCGIVLVSGIFFAVPESAGRGYDFTYPDTDVPRPVKDHKNDYKRPVPASMPMSPAPAADEEEKPGTMRRLLERKDKTVAALQKQLEVKERTIRALHDRVERLSNNLEEKEAQLYMMQGEPAERYIVRKGDNLWDIAGREEIYGDPYRWITIYNANMSKIDDPNVIFPGQLFEIPK